MINFLSLPSQISLEEKEALLAETMVFLDSLPNTPREEPTREIEERIHRQIQQEYEMFNKIKTIMKMVK